MFIHLFEKCQKFNISMQYGGVNPPKIQIHRIDLNVFFFALWKQDFRFVRFQTLWCGLQSMNHLLEHMTSNLKKQRPSFHSGPLYSYKYVSGFRISVKYVTLVNWKTVVKTVSCQIVKNALCMKTEDRFPTRPKNPLVGRCFSWLCSCHCQSQWEGRHCLHFPSPVSSQIFWLLRWFYSLCLTSSLRSSPNHHSVSYKKTKTS